MGNRAENTHLNPTLGLADTIPRTYIFASSEESLKKQSKSENKRKLDTFWIALYNSSFM